MSYVDGFVLAVPAANKDEYVVFARKGLEMWKSLGATRLVECWGDDVPKGKITDFSVSVKAKEDEVVVFAWLEWPSKEVRDAAMKKMMEDPNMSGMQMPFDGSRMIYGGFQPVLDESF